MTPCIDYPTCVTIYKTATGKYGNDEAVIDSADVKCVWEQTTGWSRGGYRQEINADIVMFINPKDAFAKKYHYRLEGMFVAAPTYSEDDTSKAWYKIESVTVSHAHQLGNRVDNVQLALKKTKGPRYVS